MVIFPGSAFMAVAHTVARVMAELKVTGTTEHLVGEMTTLTDAFELMGPYGDVGPGCWLRGNGSAAD